MIESFKKGLLTEIQCEKDFISRDIMLSKPIGANSRYDYLIDINNKFYRIQCKSANLREDDQTYFTFKTVSNNIRSGEKKYYTKDEIDFFYTHLNGISYLVPVEEAGRGDAKLRFSALQNQPSIHWAKDYELDKMLATLVAKEEVE